MRTLTEMMASTLRCHEPLFSHMLTGVWSFPLWINSAWGVSIVGGPCKCLRARISHNWSVKQAFLHSKGSSTGAVTSHNGRRTKPSFPLVRHSHSVEKLVCLLSSTASEHHYILIKKLNLSNMTLSSWEGKHSVIIRVLFVSVNIYFYI